MSSTAARFCLRPARRRIVLLACLGLGGCASTPTEQVGTTPEGCVRGQSVACACLGGLRGVQVCGSDRAYGACQCPGLDAALVDVVRPTPDVVSEVSRPAPDLPTVDAGAEAKPDAMAAGDALGPGTMGVDVQTRVCNGGVCRSCPAGMALVPAGSFVMGSSVDEPGAQSDERPQRRVTLGDYCLGLTEVSVAEFRRCVAAGSCPPITTPATCNWTTQGRENHPIDCIDWAQANAVCAFLHPGTGRLPTEAEWENAASAGGTRRFPWGDELPSTPPCWRVGGNRRDSTCAVGSSPADRTPTGIFDMAGNAAEMVADWYGAYPVVAETDPRGPVAGTLRVHRGRWYFESDVSRFRARFRGQSRPADFASALGVRCAATPR